MRTISIFLFLAFLAHATQAGAITIKEKWLRDDSVGSSGVIFSDTTVNNIALVHRTGSQERAYFMQSGSIKAALSNDYGITFTDEGQRVTGNHFAVHANQSFGVRLFFNTFEATNVLFSSVSQDGFTFSDENTARLTAPTGIVHPTIVERPDGGCLMFYDEERAGNGLNFGKKIRSARSDDCLNFTADSGIRIKTGTKGLPEGTDLVFSPFASYDSANSVYKLYFTVEADEKRQSGVYLAISSDGLKFRVQGKGPVLKQSGPGGQGSSGLRGNPQDAFILIDGAGRERMYVWETDVGYRTALLSSRKVK